MTTEGHSLLESIYGGYLDKSYYTQDSLGSVIGTFNDKGRIDEKYTYDSFGRVTEGRFDNVNRLGYNGKMIDPFTGNYDYGFRDYSPVAMRFTTVDPIRSGSNWYSYVSNDPVNMIDPFGLSATDNLYIEKSEFNGKIPIDTDTSGSFNVEQTVIVKVFPETNQVKVTVNTEISIYEDYDTQSVTEVELKSNGLTIDKGVLSTENSDPQLLPATKTTLGQTTLTVPPSFQDENLTVQTKTGYRVDSASGAWFPGSQITTVELY